MKVIKYLRILLSGILAGICIGFGGLTFVVCCSLGLKIVGAFTFSIGLLLICFIGLNLYTGKIGFAFEEKRKSYVLDLLVIYIGNIIGAVMFGYLIYATNLINGDMKAVLENIKTSRTIIVSGNGGQTWYSALISSICCGALVFLAVYGWKKAEHYLLKALILIFCVATFVICGFEHCIANMFYLSLANAWSGQTILDIVITTLGNSIGALLIYFILFFIKKIFVEKNNY